MEHANLSAEQPRRPLICTIGDLILDLVVLPAAPLLADGDTPATIRLAAGGQAANVAAWVSALGGQGRLICARASDQAGQIAAAELQRQGVELRGPVIDGAGGVVVSTREVNGARTMASDPGVAAQLDAAAVDRSWVSGADLLHVSGYCLLREASGRAALAAAAAASRVTLDLASAHDIELFGAERFTELVRALRPELVFANEAERAAVGEIETRWVIKLGPGGAIFPEGAMAPTPVTVVDTTGAGDALAAGYLVGGSELAMAAAACCVESIGAAPPRDLYKRTLPARKTLATLEADEGE
jgi:sugar/nucleoside kinase (ribokinase family)